MKRKNKQPNKRVWLFLGIGLPILAVAVFFLSAPLRRQYQARHDVSELRLALRAYAITFGDLPRGTTAQICAALRGDNPTKEPVVESYVINSAGEFLDPWQTPYRFSYEPKVRVYSCGPNKIDEHGGGDDIVAE